MHSSRRVRLVWFTTGVREGDLGMSFVAINVLTVPTGAGATLEQRFAGRAGMVDSAPGFERFELLRPVEGTEDYLVVTHWASKADYQAWLDSRAFAAGHAKSGEGGGEAAGVPGAAAAGGPAAAGSQIWTFEVVQGSAAADVAH